jgi:hypothetical protein
MKAFEVWWDSQVMSWGGYEQVHSKGSQEMAWKAALEWAKKQSLMGDQSDVLREISIRCTKRN